MGAIERITRVLSEDAQQRVIDVAIEANPGLQAPVLPDITEILTWWGRVAESDDADRFCILAHTAYRAAELLGAGHRVDKEKLAIRILTAAQAGDEGVITCTTPLIYRRDHVAVLSEAGGVDYDG